MSSRASAPAPPARAGSTRSRARGRRRLLAILLAVAVLLAVAYGVTRSPLLAIDTLRVRGTSHLTPQQVLDAAGVHDGDAIVWIDTGAAVAGIESLPYVRDASLARELPHTVRITVHERVPSAWVDGPAGKVLVDRTGRVLETVDAPPPGIPQLLGASSIPPPGGTIDAQGAARVAGALNSLAAAATSTVEHTDRGIVLHLVAGTEIRMGEATQIKTKLAAALAVLGALDGQPVSYVDVSVPTNPVSG